MQSSSEPIEKPRPEQPRTPADQHAEPCDLGYLQDHAREEMAVRLGYLSLEEFMAEEEAGAALARIADKLPPQWELFEAFPQLRHDSNLH